MAQEATIKFFDMFAGIGGFRAGLERAGGFSCIGHSEIDKHAHRAYQNLYTIDSEEVFYENAKTINAEEMPDFDLLCAGFPCQSFSVAGKRRGFKDARGTLFLTSRVSLKPNSLRFFYLKTFPACLAMTRGGHLRPSSARYQNWGTAWNGRCLTASILESRSHAGGCILSDILTQNVPEKYYLSQKQAEKLLYKSPAGHKGKESMTPLASPAPSSPAPAEAAGKPGCTS